ncbi:MAG: AAA family ATPase [Alphaproteobacteria bacterium]|nr:AAA family ATPase [Alphaproteobacteria bacterium]
MQAATIKQENNIVAIKNMIEQQMDFAAWTSWIAPLNFEIADNTLILTAQNQFSADYISNTYGAMLKNVAMGFGLNVQMVVRGAATFVANDNNVQSYTPAMDEKTTSVAFDAFISSAENEFVLSAAKKVAAGTVAFSPLFIYGPAGCGKTLLAECIKSESERAIMMTGGTFVAEFARALQKRTIFAFKDYCRNCDTFILDDVQSLAGKTATMNEFLQLVMELRSMGKNVVLTSNVAPNNLSGFDRRVQSLLGSGLVVDMAAPNANVKRVMLVRAGVKADVADALANRIAGNGHIINGVANKLKTYTELMGGNVTLDVAEHLLADTLEKFKTPIAMVKSLCEKLGVTYDAVCGAGRARSLVLARQIIMVVLKNSTRLSLSEIGNYVGNRDHATVLYAIRQIEKLKATDLVLSAQIEQLIAECR